MRWRPVLIGAGIGAALATIQAAVDTGWPWGVSLASDIVYTFGRLFPATALGAVIGWLIGRKPRT